jgi:hypothetical protein
MKPISELSALLGIIAVVGMLLLSVFIIIYCGIDLFLQVLR